MDRGRPLELSGADRPQGERAAAGTVVPRSREESAGAGGGAASAKQPAGRALGLWSSRYACRALGDAFQKTMRDPEFAERLKSLDLIIAPRPGEEVQADIAKTMEHANAAARDFKRLLNL